MSKSVESVLRALGVLECFHGHDRPLRVADVATDAGLSRGTAHRLLNTLVDSGYLVVGSGGYELTPKVLRLGVGHQTLDPLILAAQPELDALTATLGLHSAVGVLDDGPLGQSVVCVASASSSGPLAVSTTIGSRLPIDSTSLGRVLRAQDPDGYQIVVGEYDPQLRTVGVPIVGRVGQVVAALAVVAADPDLPPHYLEREVLDSAWATARAIGQRLQN